MHRRIVSALALSALLLAACGTTTASPSSSPLPSSTGSRAPSLSLRDAGVEPVERPQAAIGLAFTADEAADLVAGTTDGIDFGTDALLCVYLGTRQTTGWSLDLRSVSLSGNELRISARENAPREGAAAQVTYPADCALIDRGALPPGELAVRADDTITGEFIVDAVVTVPEPGAAP